MNPKFALIALCAVVLSGCSMATGMTALQVQNGDVVSLVRLCSGISSETVKLTTNAGGEALESWEFEDGAAADVPLGDREDIIDLADTDRVTLITTVSSGHANPVWFTASDLEDLPEGEVLVGGSESEEPMTVTRPEFDALALDQCDSIE